jgi:hypothetical protein
MGGISTDSGCVVFVLVQYGRVPFGGSVLERRGRGLRGLVFGTLLGPEATGPGRVRLFPGCLFLVSWLHRSHGSLRCWRGVCGVCGTGLLFENYIVDASIFYKKQFPRI